MHPLLTKYDLGQYSTAALIPRQEVISLCEQLEWTEREMEKARSASPTVYTRPRRWVKAEPNPKVAAHRTKPTGIIAGLCSLLPILEYVQGQEVSDTGMIVLGVAALFFAGHYLIYLFFQSS